ncbi:unnamed protein product [Didymodactylos carnosus]|uniref:Uncharacterized protein n=2 Tax=Didymodactylos carnosus TaxID=1234261 RepID=A0A8S2PM89_9BILA|nr:unnamed protein product [Didymodactylos carnosus]CAF4062167.1 unnamed protein product [Didymodactylos carnosus]
MATAHDLDIDADDYPLITEPIALSTTPIPTDKSVSVQNQISDYLDFGSCPQKDQIIANLLRNGLHVLSKYEGGIIPDIYSTEMNYTPKDGSPLLKLIKSDVSDRLNVALNSQPIIKAFIDQTESENPTHYNQVLVSVRKLCTIVLPFRPQSSPP